MKKLMLAAYCAAALALTAAAESPIKFFSGEVSRHEGLGFGAFFNNQYGIGEWSDYAVASLGFGIDAEYTLPRFLPFNMDWGAALHLDYGHTFPKGGSTLARRDDIKLTIGGFLRIPFTAWGQRFAFQPEFCWGIDANNAVGQNGSKANGWYTDQIIVFAPALRWTPPGEKFDKFELEISPVWTTSPERHGNVVNELGFRLGGIFHFDLFSMGKGVRTKAEREADAQRERQETEAKKKAEEEKRIKAEREAEDERRKQEEARRKAAEEEEARLKAEQEEAERAAQEEAAALEAQRKADEEAAASEAAAALAAQQAAEEEARQKAEQEAAERAAQEEAARQKAEEEAALMNGDENLTPEQESALSEELQKNLAACKESPAILLGVDPDSLRDFTPDGDGDHDTITFIPSTAYLARPAESWTLKILDPSQNAFRTWIGSGNPPEEIVWDGKGDSGDFVFSYNAYTAALEVVPSQKDKDRLGMDSVTAKVDGAVQIKTGVVMEKSGDGEWKIEMTTIPFDPNAATFNRLTDAQRAELKRMLDDIYKKVGAIKGARVTVNGYANNLSGTEKEDREELIPLSQKRARVMADMLIERGLESERVVAQGLGGANPLASREDRANWWKNRRVEFVINK